jgi:hypothetical protein
MAPQAQSEVRASVDQAQRAMERAAQAMRENRSSSAAEAQREALDALDRALEAARDGVRPNSPEAQAEAEELARRQKEIEKELLDLATRNKERKNSKPNPALGSAAENAEDAGEALESGELAEAEDEEQRVQQDLERALEELRDEEEQYQKLRQEELLFKIAEELTALLQAETEALGQIREIDAGRGDDEKLSRAERLRLRRLGGELAQTAARTAEIAQAIETELADVFAHVLREVRQDLERVARDVDEAGGNQTGERVQALLEDSIETTQWALEALKNEQRRRENEQGQPQQPPPGPQQDGKPPLVPDVAELKLLRQLEVDTLDAIDRLVLLYPDLERADLEPEVLEDILRLAERHERTSKLFQKFRARLGLPGPEDKP